jgi:hypothetical protein
VSEISIPNLANDGGKDLSDAARLTRRPLTGIRRHELGDVSRILANVYATLAAAILSL